MLVRHAGGSYAVIVRHGACDDLPALLEERHPGARPVVVSDSTVAAVLPAPLPSATRLTFAAGEQHKTRETWAALTDRLLAERCDRQTVIVAFGGGVTTDVAGFVAATFLRGVPWVAVPTTTLGMIDAAIGGKTGVDTPAGKNLVGAFHPPSAVICDPRTLATLPERTFREGLAEAVKHAAILDDSYGDWIGAHAARIIARDPGALEALVRRSVELKAAVVGDDERESDRRAVLNAGHTVAHALERATGYTMPHGEAVAVGLLVEARTAELMKVAAPGTADRIATLLSTLALPTAVPTTIDPAALEPAMSSDKKNRGGVIHAALLASFGHVAPNGAAWTWPLDLVALRSALSRSTS